ncbi:uncharacterized protein LOC115316115 isoform X2 [Ixodes scapularis]|uniref:uncharacterized protein LOC115316115 isoform X2 n=1 Tax=Ixodes scapularis TaxID=6945 RepID=UPI001C385C81|nr:uncharacterized protein LOC115316115 isoform X2 [Ixodes scapularis]
MKHELHRCGSSTPEEGVERRHGRKDWGSCGHEEPGHDRMGFGRAAHEDCDRSSVECQQGQRTQATFDTQEGGILKRVPHQKTSCTSDPPRGDSSPGHHHQGQQDLGGKDQRP